MFRRVLLKTAISFAIAVGVIAPCFAQTQSYNVKWTTGTSDFYLDIEAAYDAVHGAGSFYGHVPPGADYASILENYGGLEANLTNGPTNMEEWIGPEYNQAWGGVPGPHLYLTQTGPDAGETVTFELNFPPGSTDISLPFLGVNGREFNGVWSYDAFTISATGPGGPIDLDLSWVNPTSTVAFSITDGGNTLDVTGEMDTNNDHVDTFTNFTFMSPLGVEIDTITILYDPDVNGTGQTPSAGFAIGDLSFTAPIPEPGVAILFLCGSAAILSTWRTRK